MMADGELLATLERIEHAFATIGIRWAIGGSFASTVYGEPRATNDIDVIAVLRAQHVGPLVTALGADFYADAQSMSEAIAARDSFNLIDERWFLKVDVFVPPPGPLGEGQLLRRRAHSLSDTGPTVFVLAPEDIILQKLRWFELGGRVSDRQWRDLVGVARLGGALDGAYLSEVAAGAGLKALLDRALSEAGR